MEKELLCDSCSIELDRDGEWWGWSDSNIHLCDDCDTTMHELLGYDKVNEKGRLNCSISKKNLRLCKTGSQFATTYGYLLPPKGER